MPDIWYDVDTALAEVPVNVLPLLDDTDFKTIEAAVAYNAGGMALYWHFVTTDGAYSVTAVTPTTGGAYDWTDQGDAGIYTIEIPASGGASINNDTEGVGWFTGVATGILPWRGPTCGFRAAALNNSLIDAGATGLLAPTTAARTLDVSATGEAGLDFDNVKAATSPTTLTNITIPTVTTTATATAVTTVNGLANNVITTASINDGAITNAKVADDVDVNTKTITAGAIAAASFAAGAINAAAIADAAIDAATFAAGAINAAAIADDAIDAASIATGALTADAFAADAIVAATLATGAITADALAANAITNAAVADDVDVNVKTITAGAITAAAIATDAIDADALATDAVAEIAGGVLDLANGVETSLTPRQALRLITAALAGKLSGAATTTVTIRNVGDSKNRIVATVDADGNRSAVTTDVS